jgi:hypothetical protein
LIKKSRHNNARLSPQAPFPKIRKVLENNGRIAGRLQNRTPTRNIHRHDKPIPLVQF